MDSTCFMYGCGYEIMYFCSCGDTKIFCCQRHLKNHLNHWSHEDNVNHKITSLFTDVPKGFLENYTRSLNSLDAVEASVKQFSQKAISQITYYEKIIVEEIRKLKEVYKNILSKVKATSNIKKDVLLSFLPTFNTFYTYSPLNKENRLFAEITTAFSDLFFKQHDEIGLYWDFSLNLLKSVNLEGAISSIVELNKFNNNCNALVLSNSFVSCQVGANTYFIKERERRTYPFLLSIKNQTIEVLPGSRDKVNYGSCVLNNNIIYFFINSSIFFDSFDLSVHVWKYLPNLPIASQDIKGSTLGDSIIYSGFNIKEVYQYKNSEFECFLNLASNTHKVICPGWIVSNKLLHENIGYYANWVSYPTTLTLINNPSSSVVFNKQFIFFISYPSLLIRIDTWKKSLKAIPIT